MMISNGEISSLYRNENEDTCFLGDSLNKKIPRKNSLVARWREHPVWGVLKDKASKTYKSSHQKVFPKIGVLETQTNHNKLHKIYKKVFENPLMEFIFSKWQLEAFHFIKFKNELLRNYFFRILPRFLMVSSKYLWKKFTVYQSSNASI